MTNFFNQNLSSKNIFFGHFFINFIKKNSKHVLVSGFVELFSAPVEAYKRDGRVLRGVRRGASAFSNSTAVAALELSGRCFDWIDYCASLTHDMVQ